MPCYTDCRTCGTIYVAMYSIGLFGALHPGVVNRFRRSPLRDSPRYSHVIFRDFYQPLLLQDIRVIIKESSQDKGMELVGVWDGAPAPPFRPVAARSN